MGRKLTFDTLTGYLDYLSCLYSDRRDEMLLVDDLARFGICDMEELFVLMGKHWERLGDEQKELDALMQTATLHFMPSYNYCSYTRAGLVRLALYLEFGRAWCEYVRSLPVAR